MVGDLSFQRRWREEGEAYDNRRAPRAVERLNEVSASLGVQAARDMQPRTGARVVTPNLFGAPCSTPEGIKLLDEAVNGRSKNAAKHRERFVRQCLEQCSVYEQCRAWVVNGEGRFPGQWGRIYAGLTVNDRKRLAREREQRIGHELEGAGDDTTDQGQ